MLCGTGDRGGLKVGSLCSRVSGGTWDPKPWDCDNPEVRTKLATRQTRSSASGGYSCITITDDTEREDSLSSKTEASGRAVGGGGPARRAEGSAHGDSRAPAPASRHVPSGFGVSDPHSPNFQSKTAATTAPTRTVPRAQAMHSAFLVPEKKQQIPELAAQVLFSGVLLSNFMHTAYREIMISHALESVTFDFQNASWEVLTVPSTKRYAFFFSEEEREAVV